LKTCFLNFYKNI